VRRRLGNHRRMMAAVRLSIEHLKMQPIVEQFIERMADNISSTAALP
jgi:hypothetical protein